MRSATLEAIAKANGKKTGDEMVAEMTAKERAEIEEQKRSGYWLSSAERRRLRKMARKAEKMEATDVTPNVEFSGQAADLSPRSSAGTQGYASGGGEE